MSNGFLLGTVNIKKKNTGLLLKCVKKQLGGPLAPSTTRHRPDSRRVLFTVVHRSTGLPGTVAVHRSTIKTTVKTLETRP